MDWIVAAIPGMLVAGVLALAGAVAYRLWRSAMRGEPLLLHRMLARSGLSLEASRDPDLVAQTGAAVRRCMMCADRAACLRWLEDEDGGPVAGFCPNAELMDRMKAGQGG